MNEVEIRPIKTEEDYRSALVQMEPLMDAQPGSDDEAALEVLGTLIIQYETEHFDMRPPSVPAAIEYYIESRGLTRDDMLAAIREASPKSQNGARVPRTVQLRGKR